MDRCINFAEFKLGTDTWKNYGLRLRCNFKANNITDDSAKKTNFLAVCGATMIDHITSLIAPKDLEAEEVTFAMIEAALNKHHNPKPNEIMERFNFKKK